jgi:hypothetical protein
MDIKPKRREAYQQLADDYPRRNFGQGSAASDQNRFWFVRAQSWSEGADVNSYRDVELENDGEHERWGTPYQDNCPNPAAPFNHADDPLPDPNNFHSNPGYLGTSTASMLQQSLPGSIYRTPGGGNEGHRPMKVGGRRVTGTPGKTVVPAGPARQPASEGAPLVVTTGGVPGR